MQNENTVDSENTIGLEIPEIKEKLKNDQRVISLWIASGQKNQTSIDVKLAMAIAYWTHYGTEPVNVKESKLVELLRQAEREQEVIDNVVSKVRKLYNSNLLRTWRSTLLGLVNIALGPVIDLAIEEMEQHGLYLVDFGIKDAESFTTLIMRTQVPAETCEKIIAELESYNHYAVGVRAEKQVQMGFLSLLVKLGVKENRRGDDIDTLKGFTLGANGLPLGTQGNVLCVLEKDMSFDKLIKHNQFNGKTELRDELPEFMTKSDSSQLTDVHLTEMAVYMEKKYGLIPSNQIVYQAVQAESMRHSYHPVRDYLTGIRWDGKERINGWLPNILKTVDSPFTHYVGRIFLISCVARVMKPGCKVDTMLVLEGAKGVGKSTAIHTLSNGWYKDEPLDLKNGAKEAYLQIRGCWIYEIAEMHWNKAEASAIKAFLTKTVDSSRDPYARTTTECPRQVVFAGTVNPGSVSFHDYTPERRYLTVNVNDYVDLGALSEVKDQLWAEAFSAYKGGEPWYWKPSDEIAKIVEDEQASRYEPHILTDIVVNWVFLKYRQQVSVLEVLQGIYGDNFNPSKIMRSEQTAVGVILVQLGWEKKRSGSGNRGYYYQRPMTSFTKFASGLAKSVKNTDEFWQLLSEKCREQPAFTEEMEKLDENVRFMNIELLEDYLRVI